METGDVQLPRLDATLPKDIVNFSKSYHRLIEPILRVGDPKDLADILAEQRFRFVDSEEGNVYRWVDTSKIAEHCLEYGMVPNLGIYDTAEDQSDSWIRSMNDKFGKGNWIDVEMESVDKQGKTHDAVFAFVKRSALSRSAFGQQLAQAERLADNPQMEWGINVNYPTSVTDRTVRFNEDWWQKHVGESIGEGKRFQVRVGDDELNNALRAKLQQTEKADKSRDLNILVIGERKRDEGWDYISDTTGGGIYAYRETNPTRGRRVFRDRSHIAIDCIKVK